MQKPKLCHFCLYFMKYTDLDSLWIFGKFIVEINSYYMDFL